MRCLWCNNSWYATRIIRQVLKWPKGGLGACIGIIPKERYEWYQEFHDQKKKKMRKRKKGWTSWWLIWPINMMLLQQCLPALKRNERDPHLSTCLCPLVRVTCRWQMTIDVGTVKGETIKLEKLRVCCWKWQLWTFSIVRTYLIELLSPIVFARYWMLQRWLVQSPLFQVGRKLEVSHFFKLKLFPKMFLQKYFIHTHVNYLM